MISIIIAVFTNVSQFPFYTTKLSPAITKLTPATGHSLQLPLEIIVVRTATKAANATPKANHFIWLLTPMLTLASIPIAAQAAPYALFVLDSFNNITSPPTSEQSGSTHSRNLHFYNKILTNMIVFQFHN